MQLRRFWMKVAALAVTCMTAFSTAGIPAQAQVHTMPDGGVFDDAYYAQNNPDVVQALGKNPMVLYQHYLKYGKAEGRMAYDPSAASGAAYAQNDTVYDPSATTGVAHTQNEYTAQIIKLVNQARAQAGVPALSESAVLDKDAAQRAVEVNTRQAHIRPDGSAWYTLDPANMYGENIAFEFELSDSPEDVFTAWMNSEGHRANILDPSFSAIGVGYYINDNNSVSIVQNFG